MNPYDEILAWASERQTGAVTQLRSVCEWVSRRTPGSGSALDVLADLEALGHVEVRDNRWSIVPTMLSRLADGGGNALMIGSRSKWLMDAVDDLDGCEDAGLRDLADHVYENVRIGQQAPSSWYLAAGPEAPLDALRAVGVTVFDDVAGAQLRKVADGDPTRVFREVRPGELTGTLDADLIGSSGRAEWIPVTNDRAQGYYRYLRNNQRVYAQRTSEGWIEMDYRWAVWLALPRSRSSFWFVPRERRLYVRGKVRPPLPIERALVLRTGRLPTRLVAPDVTGTGESVLVYTNITSQIATQVASYLAKELEFK